MSGEKFGAFVRREREAKEIGLREMAKMIGVSPTYLSKIERDEFPPPVEHKVRAIAKIINCDADELLARAGRVSSDLSDIIKRRPIELAALLRTTKGLMPRTSPGWPAKCKSRRASDGLGGAGFNDANADAKEDADYMTRFVPYLSEEVIERDAAALLAEYAQARGVTVKPPIPIEDIVEKHLKLGIEFDDTHKLFGMPRSGCRPDILGAIFFDDGPDRDRREPRSRGEPGEGRPLSFHACP